MSCGIRVILVRCPRLRQAAAEPAAGPRGVSSGSHFAVGRWLSPVKRLLWEQEIAGSNPARPTNPFIRLSRIRIEPLRLPCGLSRVVVASAGGRRAKSASTQRPGRAGLALAGLYAAAGRSPRTLETHTGSPSTSCCRPRASGRGIDSATKINQRFLDPLTAELLDSGRSPASVHSYLRSINGFLHPSRWQAAPALPAQVGADRDVPEPTPPVSRTTFTYLGPDLQDGLHRKRHPGTLAPQGDAGAAARIARLRLFAGRCWPPRRLVS
jgi:hypothetical protein